MAARVVNTLPEDDEWLYEVKFDGYRALLKNGTRVRIRSRNDKDLTRMYPTVAAAGLRVNADQAVIDGELVAVDAKGHPSFQALQHQLSAAEQYHAAIAYSRPRGNTDPDADPSNSQTITAPFLPTDR
jgi:bifunctional non-homologous end joining protein LigD